MPAIYAEYADQIASTNSGRNRHALVDVCRQRVNAARSSEAKGMATSFAANMPQSGLVPLALQMVDARCAHLSPVAVAHQVHNSRA
jgi:hypothetical protein